MSMHATSPDHLRAPPPPRSSRHSALADLPAPLTPLVGREREAAVARELLSRPDVRLLTLTGPGGIGKTRLALSIAAALADDFADGVAWVQLAPIAQADLVVSAIARGLGLREVGDLALLDVLKSALHEADTLLVLDNCEHVLASAPFLTDLLSVCPRLKILTTSRALLRVTGEQVLPVPPLDLPDPKPAPLLDDLARSEAVRLFMSRAQAVAPNFALTEPTATLVAAICRRLDGLPLAIELAAARVNVLPLATLRDRLDRRLSLLTGGTRDAPRRHQTMRDAIAWSHDLLTEDEQAVFRSLAVFAGGFTIEGAEAVRGGGGEGETPGVRSAAPSAPSVVQVVASLVDQCLLQREPEATPSGYPEPRFRMLETVREYAAERLAASGEEATVRTAHAAWSLALAEQADAAFRSRSEHDARWLARLEDEHANLRAALAWLIAAKDRELSLRLAGALGAFWYFRGHLSEGRSWLAQALECHPDGPPAVRARALQHAGALAHTQGDDRHAVPLLEASLLLWRTVGNPWGTALTLLQLGVVAEDSGDYDRAEPLIEEALALFRADSNAIWVATTYYHLGVLAYGRGDFVRAAALGEQAKLQFQEAGDAWGAAFSGDLLGLVAVELGDPQRAATSFAEALPVLQELGQPDSLLCRLAGVATLAVAAGRAHVAARLFGAAAAMAEGIGFAFDLPARATFERAAEAGRERLGEPAFAAAWGAGRALPVEAAVAEALELATALATAASTPSRASLTPREAEILSLLAEGRTDREIAEALFVSVRTVEGHVSHILAKLGVRTRMASVTAAVAAGLVAPDPPAPPP